MIQQDSLAHLALDTLPFNIAVLDRDGTILFTNRAWREFAGADAIDRGEMVGINYFESMDVSSDENAARAKSGLEAVIAGEQDVFTLEYPCHSETEKHWFLMRAAALPDHEVGSVVVAHIDITQRKLAELRARDQRRELEHMVSRIDGLIHAVTEAVLQASSRQEIERAVCERLSAVDAYAGAWIGRVDLRTETLSPVETSGVDLPEGTTVDLDGADPAAEALRTGTPQVGGTDFRRTAGVNAQVALPLSYNDTRYGGLVVYADSASVFDERELTVLGVLAQFASTAINALESRRILTSDRVIEMELSLAPEELFVGGLAQQFDTKFAYEGTTYEDDGSVVMLFLAETEEPEAVVGAAESFDRVGTARRVGDGSDGSIFEFLVDTPPVVSALAERGAETTDLTADREGVHVELELPASADPRTVVEHLNDQYPSAELLARHERERPEQTKRELVADIEESLTARQELALRKAYLGGFFNWPRDISGEDLAESMDISPSTYHQHLRTAERKVLASLFEG